jgi:LysM domain
VTDRGLPLADGASACPFVAFDDDRDERSSVPDHRHRCYAESPPAPRAIAHQEAYCLSSAFPVCPVFQDWARREAARARGDGTPENRPPRGALVAGAAGRPAERGDPDDREGSLAGARGADGTDDDGEAAEGVAGVVAGAAAGAAGGGRDPDDGPGGDDRRPRRGDDRMSSDADAGDADADGGGGGPAMPNGEPDAVRRNPPRDWAAPPPWLASAEGRVGQAEDVEPPGFLGRRASEPGQGLAGSPADRLAGGAPPSRRRPDDERWSEGPGPIEEDVGVASAAAAATPRVSRPTVPLQPDDAEFDEEEPPQRRITRRPRAYDQHLGGPDGPDWERPRRYDAYPTIRTRVGLPRIPRLVGIAALIVVLAVALFFLPSLLNLGGQGGAPAASSSHPPVASASLAPTVPPAPTAQVYTLKHGDTLSKVAAKNGLTIEELLAANPDIKNPNKVAEGQQIIIPAPSAAPPQQVGGSAGPSAKAGGSSAP